LFRIASWLDGAVERQVSTRSPLPTHCRM
jgi:hypothetical protein